MKTNKTPSAYQQLTSGSGPSLCVHLLSVVSGLRSAFTPHPAMASSAQDPLTPPHPLPAGRANTFSPASISGHLWCGPRAGCSGNVEPSGSCTPAHRRSHLAGETDPGLNHWA